MNLHPTTRSISLGPSMGLAALSAAAVLAATPALAQSDAQLAAEEEQFSPEASTVPEGDGFGLSYGVTVTSNYIDDGTTQSDDKPALQGYVEGAYALVYGGVFVSTVDFGDGDDDQLEFDIYAGLRPSFGDLSIDVGYVRYLYDDSGDCCGEAFILAEYPASDLIAVAGEVYWDPELDTTWTKIGTDVSVAEVWAIGGSIGTDFGSLDFGSDKVAWDVGVARFFAENYTLDFRYYDSNYDPETFVVSLSADF